jgi:predicted permease
VLVTDLVGLLPALRTTRISLTAVMKHRPGTGAPTLSGAGRWIVGAQVALSLVLLIGGGLLWRSFAELITQDPGFEPQHVLIMSAKTPVFAADTVNVSVEERPALYEDVTRRLRLVPGVTSVGRTFTTPIGIDNWQMPITADPPNPEGTEKTLVYFNFITPGYFETLRMKLLAGRVFGNEDTKNSTPVAIVNETIARTFFTSGSSLGRHFRIPRQATPIEIVGIVKDSKYGSLREDILPTVFLPAAQAPAGASAEEFVLRTSVQPEALIPLIRRGMADVGAKMPLQFETLGDRISASVVQEKMLAILAGFFSALALMLATFGLYGVLSHLIVQRRGEFGIRMALGASRHSIVNLVIREVAKMLVGGIILGLCVAFATVKLLQGTLFGLDVHDPLTIAVAIAALCVAGVLAGSLPALRATRVDPIEAIRAQ